MPAFEDHAIGRIDIITVLIRLSQDKDLSTSCVDDNDRTYVQNSLGRKARALSGPSDWGKWLECCVLFSYLFYLFAVSIEDYMFSQRSNCKCISRWQNIMLLQYNWNVFSSLLLFCMTRIFLVFILHPVVYNTSYNYMFISLIM